MPKKSVSSMKKNAVKPKEGAELSESDSVKEGIGGLKAEADRQEEEAQRYAVAFFQKVMRLKGVAIERDHFLSSEFRKRGVADEQVKRAISTSPAAAGGWIPTSLTPSRGTLLISRRRNRASFRFPRDYPAG